MEASWLLSLISSLSFEPIELVDFWSLLSMSLQIGRTATVRLARSRRRSYRGPPSLFSEHFVTSGSSAPPGFAICRHSSCWTEALWIDHSHIFETLSKWPALSNYSWLDWLSNPSGEESCCSGLGCAQQMAWLLGQRGRLTSSLILLPPRHPPPGAVLLRSV